MKKIYSLALALATGIIVAACGGAGGGSSSGSSGTVSMNVTDAKPTLPIGDVESITVTFDEVSVHKSGGGWITLTIAPQLQSKKIDLYQFSNGTTTQFVPPGKLESGKYTQVRIGVTSAEIKIKDLDEPLVLEIPSENLKTDKNFEFDLPDGKAVDLIVDFDLSQSIVVTGADTYQLKPVVHINETSKAATIKGIVSWGTATEATVTVIWDKLPDGSPLDPTNDEEYTKITILRTETSTFEIFWLVPNQGYFVKVESSDGSHEYYVPPDDLGPGEVFTLS